LCDAARCGDGGGVAEASSVGAPPPPRPVAHEVAGFGGASMKVTLISLDQMIISSGVRTISSGLRERGHATEILFARAVTGRPLSEKVLEALTTRCAGSGLVGLSLMSNAYPQAVALTQALRRRVCVPIVWGGVHPTFRPEESLAHADIVCVGEGETAMCDLADAVARGDTGQGIAGLWTRGKDGIVRGGVASLAESLDALPAADLGPEGHAIRDGDALLDMTPALFEKFLTKRDAGGGRFVAEYYVSTSRGCPFRCAYCASSTIKALYGGRRFFRLRSPVKVVEEVVALTGRFPFIRWIYFADDDLFATPISRLEEFTRLWRERVGLPFYATTAPWSYDETKAALLRDAGLEILNIGIQSVSERSARLYRRPTSRETLARVTASVARLGLRQPPVYDFILDNPYETDADRLENLDFILSLPRPLRLQLFSLVAFPGTELYDRMKADGLLADEAAMIYSKSYSYPAPDYINMLTFLAGTSVSRGLLRALRTRPFLWLFHNRAARWAFRVAPYGFFVAVVRRGLNFRFWRWNADAKGDA